jgi:hypothetical protein
MIHQGFLGAMRAFHLPSLRLDVLSIRLEVGHTWAFRVHGDCFSEDTRFTY